MSQNKGGKSGKPKFVVSSPYRDEPSSENKKMTPRKNKNEEQTKKHSSSGKITSIDSDGDFDRYNLHDWDIEELDKLQDNRKSGFWKMSWFEVTARLILFAAVDYINDQGWANPHDEHYVFADWKFEKITYDPFPADSPTPPKKKTYLFGLLKDDVEDEEV